MLDNFFTSDDIERINGLTYDPALGPRFEFCRAALQWDDETPTGLSFGGLMRLATLFAARSLLHQGRPLEGTAVNGHELAEVWAVAKREVPAWPGFKRVELKDEERAYLQEWLEANKGLVEELEKYLP